MTILISLDAFLRCASVSSLRIFPDGNAQLLERQKTVINYMMEQGFISKADGEAAKKVVVLDKVKPADNQLSGAKAPHFIQMVKDELTDKLGAKVMGQGWTDDQDDSGHASPRRTGGRDDQAI